MDSSSSRYFRDFVLCSLVACGVLLAEVSAATNPSNVITWPAPAGEVASPDYQVDVDGVPVFVHQARVRAKILENKGLWTHELDCKGEIASFAIFDIKAKVVVTVKPNRAFSTAIVLPSRAGVVPQIVDGTVRFTLDKPQPLTVLLDGDNSRALHLLVGAPETNVPVKGDTNVVYFGPGLHEIDTVKIKSGQTVYLAGGAVVRAKLKPGEKGVYNDQWKISFYNGVVFDAYKVQNVKICGRGILDGSLVPHPGRNLICINGSKNVELSGITLRDAPNWNVQMYDSDQVVVKDLRIISGRLNSDGINSVNSRQVRVQRCFVRNHDDSIVVKTAFAGKLSEDIIVEDCVIWNDWGYALGATYETRSDIRNLRFRRCDIISARTFCLGVHVSDSATVSNIVFQDIRVADLATTRQKYLEGKAQLVKMIIVSDCWGKDVQRGHVRDIVVDGVTLEGAAMVPSVFIGADAEHQIENVVLRGIHFQGKPSIMNYQALKIHTNEFVRGLKVE